MQTLASLAVLGTQRQTRIFLDTGSTDVTTPLRLMFFGPEEDEVVDTTPAGLLMRRLLFRGLVLRNLLKRQLLLRP